MKRFEEQAVWMRSARLSAALYQTLDAVNEFGFREQITSAGLAIPAFIAQGYQAWSDKELLDSLNFAKGATGELRSHLFIAMDIGYIDQETGMVWVSEAEKIAKNLDDLMQAILAQNKDLSL